MEARLKKYCTALKYLKGLTHRAGPYSAFQFEPTFLPFMKKERDILTKKSIPLKCTYTPNLLVPSNGFVVVVDSFAI